MNILNHFALGPCVLFVLVLAAFPSTLFFRRSPVLPPRPQRPMPDGDEERCFPNSVFTVVVTVDVIDDKKGSCGKGGAGDELENAAATAAASAPAASAVGVVKNRWKSASSERAQTNASASEASVVLAKNMACLRTWYSSIKMVSHAERYSILPSELRTTVP